MTALQRNRLQSQPPSPGPRTVGFLPADGSSHADARPRLSPGHPPPRASRPFNERMKHADRLAQAMTRAAIELASLVGLPGEPDEDRILDTEQVPGAAWNAATSALDYLMVGVGIIDSCKDTQPMIDGKLDAELAALLGGQA